VCERLKCTNRNRSNFLTSHLEPPHDIQKARRHVREIATTCGISRQSLAPPPIYLSPDIKNKITNVSARHKTRHIYGSGQLKLCATPSPPFTRDGNISVADCMSIVCLNACLTLPLGCAPIGCNRTSLKRKSSGAHRLGVNTRFHKVRW